MENLVAPVLKLFGNEIVQRRNGSRRNWQCQKVVDASQLFVTICIEKHCTGPLICINWMLKPSGITNGGRGANDPLAIPMWAPFKNGLP